MRNFCTGSPPPPGPAAGSLTADAGTLQKETHSHRGAPDIASHLSVCSTVCPSSSPSPFLWAPHCSSPSLTRDAPGLKTRQEESVINDRGPMTLSGDLWWKTLSLCGKKQHAPRKGNSAKPAFVFCRHTREGAGRVFGRPVLMVRP